MIFYGKQFLDEADIEEVVKVLKSDFLTTGPKVKEFEEKFAAYVGSKYAVAVANGTAGLHLACMASDIGPEDEVIVTPLTFAASVNCVLYCSGKPIFVDVTDQGLIDVAKIEEKITPKTKAIIPVHYSGLSCDMEKIKEIADKNNLAVIEDACHAIGAKYKENKVGSCNYSGISVFSFHPVKHITTGEGGMITTNDEEVYKKLLKLRNHGITKDSSDFTQGSGEPWYHEMQELGYNYRLTDIQCALGASQLSKSDEFIERRREIANKYKEAFEGKVDFLDEKEGQYDSYHLFVIKTDKRKELFDFLKSKEIMCQVHYMPVYWHPYYQKLGYEKGLCPAAEEFYSKILSIPIYPSMTDQEVDEVIKNISEFFGGV